jgi:predicted RNA binding protein YcfA (HicA-like mRNA interferase family)
MGIGSILTNDSTRVIIRSMKEKLIQRFLTDQTHIKITDCDSLLTGFGFEHRKSAGSHRAFHKKGERPIIVITPKHSKYVKKEYVELIVKRLNLEG